MAREIKFRAWDKKCKRMIYDPKIGFYEGTYSYSINDEFTNHDEDMVYLQYTGLKDKNGKEIYEGDIVNVHHFDPMGNDIRYIGLVQFSVYGGAQIARPNGEFDFVREYEYGRHEESLEIIGDIYKYPDLLSQ